MQFNGILLDLIGTPLGNVSGQYTEGQRADGAVKTWIGTIGRDDGSVIAPGNYNLEVVGRSRALINVHEKEISGDTHFARFMGQGAPPGLHR
jgi:hypothetical protein